MIIAVIGVVVIPTFVNRSTAPALRTAANILACDIEFAEGESITHPSDLRQIQFDGSGNRYWIAASASAATPLTSPVDGQPYLNDFTTGRSAEMTGISLSAINLTNNAMVLQFDAYGRPVGQLSNPSIRLVATDGSTMTVTVDATTGETSISSP